MNFTDQGMYTCAVTRNDTREAELSVDVNVEENTISDEGENLLLKLLLKGAIQKQ